MGKREIVPWNNLCNTADILGVWQEAGPERERMFQKDEECDPDMIIRVGCRIWGLILSISSH